MFPCLDMQSNAKFILVVEKDASFQKLLDENTCSKLYPCIIMTVRITFCFGTGFAKIYIYMRMKHVCVKAGIAVTQTLTHI